ncbi:MAG: trypsin-like peptidase domain-containing protein, partial [Eubacteriales bacterium]
MEHNGFYSSDHSYQNDRKGHGGNAFATIVIFIVVILLVLLIVGLFWPSLLGIDPNTLQVPAATATPEAGAQAPLPTPDETESSLPEAPAATPEPTQTPEVSSEDRQMPELDGIAPMLPGIVENPIPDIYDAVSPGVVGVLNYVAGLSMTGKPIDELYGSGTGFAVSSEGYVLTNAHVVEGADKLTVKVFGEEEEREAILIGADTETDIAVLKVADIQLQPLK